MLESPIAAPESKKGAQISEIFAQISTIPERESAISCSRQTRFNLLNTRVEDFLLGSFSGHSPWRHFLYPR